jgi:hypothetical protein
MLFPWMMGAREKALDTTHSAAAMPGSPHLGFLTYAPLPLEAERNDYYGQGYTWPKGNSDRYKWYNNTYWGNRLPPAELIIGTRYAPHQQVRQKTFWTQYSPEQSIRLKQNLTGGPFSYGMSVQQSSNILQQMSASWRASTGMVP